VLGLLFQQPGWIDYSPDLSHLLYGVAGPDVPEAPHQSSANIYLMGSNPLEEPSWIFHGLGVSSARAGVQLLGMSPDASVVYVAYEGKLLPQDAARSGWGLYEYRDGHMREAGVLPDGSVPLTGALPAATASVATEYSLEDMNNPASLDNQVSENGMRVFFVAGGELYVHIISPDGSEHSVLVSGSQMPGHVGEPAPQKVHLFANFTRNHHTVSAPTYAYASSDGSHVFFESEDQLTAQAPSNSELKVYASDVETEKLEYLPGVALGGIVAAASDGSSFVFVNDAATPELERWVAGPDGGSVTPIVQLPGGGFVGPARLVADNSVLVFQASAPIAGFNNAGTEQIYRYDASTNELGCVSCPPTSVVPSGGTYMSDIDQYANNTLEPVFTPEGRIVNDVRGVSSDGTKIFFESPDPLVARDIDGQPDVYEWANGSVYLLSSGTSQTYSLLLDNSESGGDVFFATTDELVEGDNDGTFDVYDARIPRPGDNPPPAAVPCEGDVCQGPPKIAELLGPPPSATFNGAGNVTEPAPGTAVKTTTPRKVSSTQRLARALRVCRKRRAQHRRRVCEARARRRYGVFKSVAGKHKSGRVK
jgi:hypothetical protein